MKIRQIKHEAKKTLKGLWGYAILISIITFGINTVIPLIVEALISGGFNNGFNQQNSPPSSQLVSWIFSIVISPVIFGYYSTFLDIKRNQPVEIKNLFYAFGRKLYFKVLGVYLLTVIYTVLWSLLFIIPGIIKSFAYSQVYFILKDDPEISPNAAITKSKQLMKGNKSKYFLLLLSFFGWIILCILSLGIGFIWLVPYYTASLATFYEGLVNNRDGKEFI